MTNFIIQDEYQNPKPKTPNPNSETQNHTQNPNPKTQEFWIGFGIVTSLWRTIFLKMYFSKFSWLVYVKSIVNLSLNSNKAEDLVNFLRISR